MHSQTSAAGGPLPSMPAPKSGPERPFVRFEQQSKALPFGQPVALDDISGPTYLTAQTLVQQVAYSLSDRLWTYSPLSFDLDAAVKRWTQDAATNALGYAPGVQAMQIRAGAASVALGYVFSKDYDLSRRHVPQSIVATTASLLYMRSALDQLSLLYSLSNPFVAHVAAVDYVGSGDKDTALVADYTSAMTLADDLGLGAVCGSSAHEAQHMALLSTLMASVMPTLHLYDGVKLAQETTRVIDALDKSGLQANYLSILEEASKDSHKRADTDTKVLKLLKAFNYELGTDYRPFEYHGHASPEVVLVAFGTVESSLLAQVARSLEKDGLAVGAITVRVYRPFLEDEFIRILPRTAKKIGVLGQVKNQMEVVDKAVQSLLYRDVLAAVTFNAELTSPPSIVDVKYPCSQVWKPVSIAAAIQIVLGRPLFKGDELVAASSNQHLELIDGEKVQQYTFWGVDDSTVSNVPAVIAQALAKDSSQNVATSTKYDNLYQGGVHRTDIRKSKKTIDASYSIEGADTVYIEDESLIKSIDVCQGVKDGGKLLLRMPNIKDEVDLEKRLPLAFRKTVKEKNMHLYVVDPQAYEEVETDAELESFILQAAFLRVALPNLEGAGLPKLAALNGNAEVFAKVATFLENALRYIQMAKEWTVEEKEAEMPKLQADIRANSFMPSTRAEEPAPSKLKSWETAAKAMMFKEAYAAKPSLRPELGHKTWTVKLLEHRRLTPLTYDRNIMHLEFDLGDSGLEYNIGDSLGIHPRNDHSEVMAFIESYGLDSEAVVELQSRDDADVMRSITVYQALSEYVDLFGKPGRQFYEMLAPFATDPAHEKSLKALGGSEGATEFKRRSEVDTITFADVLEEFPSAHPELHELARLIPALKRREYSIASCQKVQPTTVSLMIVTVDWVDPRGRDRFGLATRYLDALRPGDDVTVSLKPSVMKLPPHSTDPIIMAGLGTGLAPFRAFVQHRAWERAHGAEIGPVLLYMGSRHQREEYCYGEEWEAYRDAGVISLLSCAFSRDQPHKIYIQDRMRETGSELDDAYVGKPGAFYLCGPTWPVPDVTTVLEERIAATARREGRKVSPRTEIERLKDEGRYVLEVY